MPGLLGGTEAVLRFIAEQLGREAYVNLMGWYYRAGKIERYAEERARATRSRGSSVSAGSTPRSARQQPGR
jgi:putative pyruvate formate lyase activating enzyme